MGKNNRPPKIVNGDKKGLADKAIWSDSAGNVIVTALATTNPATGASGFSLLLDGVQVPDARYGSDDVDFNVVTSSKGAVQPSLARKTGQTTVDHILDTWDDPNDAIDFA